MLKSFSFLTYVRRDMATIETSFFFRVIPTLDFFFVFSKGATSYPELEYNSKIGVCRYDLDK